MNSDQIWIESIETLREFAARLGRVTSDARNAFENALAEAGRRLLRIEHLLQQQRSRLETAHRRMQEEEDGDANEHLAREIEALEQAVGVLERQLILGDRAISDFRHSAATNLESLTADVQRARNFLEDRSRATVAYRAITTDRSQGTGSISGRDDHSSLSPSSVTTVELGEVRLPDGFQWIPISEIAATDLPILPQDWNKISKADMTHGLTVFVKEIVPLLQRGQSLSAEALSEIDKAAGRSGVFGFVHPDSLENIFRVMFGNECVAVSRTENGWSVTNGRHRIAVARELGWSHVPSRIL